MIRRAVFAYWEILGQISDHQGSLPCQALCLSSTGDLRQSPRDGGELKFDACERRLRAENQSHLSAPKLCCGLSDLAEIEVHRIVRSSFCSQPRHPGNRRLCKRRRCHGNFSSAALLVTTWLLARPPPTTTLLVVRHACGRKRLSTSPFTVFSAGLPVAPNHA
jgi:hypothetical protein